ncbi:hypothetical protein HDU83_003916 [Entophlyctis luteolus]|nr:hypothetical protein HDU83_003916 [Entophlyctis luteolus]
MDRSASAWTHASSRTAASNRGGARHVVGTGVSTIGSSFDAAAHAAPEYDNLFYNVSVGKADAFDGDDNRHSSRVSGRVLTIFAVVAVLIVLAIVIVCVKVFAITSSTSSICVSCNSTSAVVVAATSGSSGPVVLPSGDGDTGGDSIANAVVTAASTVAAVATISNTGSSSSGSAGSSTASTNCNILSYATSTTDYSAAIWAAYTECIQTGAGSVLVVPAGTYPVSVSLSSFSGSGWTFLLEGTLSLIFDASATGELLLFSAASNVWLTGSGSIQGNGASWRPNDDITLYPNRPSLIRFDGCANSGISGSISLLNAPAVHVWMVQCAVCSLSGVSIVADTISGVDGIIVSGSGNTVSNVQVQAGGECVSVKTPTSGFTASNIVCKSTGGCELGSSNVAGGTFEIENVYYKGVTLTDASHAAWIKGVPSNDGYIRNVVFEDFAVTDALYVMGIDLYSCTSSTCPSATGSLAVSNVTFSGFSGTQASSSARPIVALVCLGTLGCTDINFANIDVSSGTGTADWVSSACGSGRSTVPSC